MSTRRVPSTLAISSTAPATMRYGSVSPIGEPFAMLPTSVPAFLICAEPKMFRMRCSSGMRSRVNCSSSVSETLAPAMIVPSSSRRSRNASIFESDSIVAAE